MKTYDLLTSCDDNLAIYLLPQIASMKASFIDSNVNFHLAHSRISPENIALIADFSKECGINFIEHKITDNSLYEELAKSGGEWPPEAYYSLGAHTYLDCERVLYFDAGDILFDGDIARYYFEDFGNNYLIATNVAFLTEGNRILPFKAEVMTDITHIKRVLRGILNSGSYVMNLELMRKNNLGAKEFIGIRDDLTELFGTTENLYWGDQGFIGMAFFGRILFPAGDYIQNVYYMPYNFCVWYFEKLDFLWYEPFVIHFAGGKGKPWKSLYSIEEIGRIIENAENGEPPIIKRFAADFYDTYFRFAKSTPVYRKIKQAALSAAEKNI
jgi:lipopolysaccharide biosynthesis glycosyltransferase